MISEGNAGVSTSIFLGIHEQSLLHGSETVQQLTAYGRLVSIDRVYYY